jgi:hypothetical protein
MQWEPAGSRNSSGIKNVIVSPILGLQADDDPRKEHIEQGDNNTRPNINQFDAYSTNPFDQDIQHGLAGQLAGSQHIGEPTSPFLNRKAPPRPSLRSEAATEKDGQTGSSASAGESLQMGASSSSNNSRMRCSACGTKRIHNFPTCTRCMMPFQPDQPDQASATQEPASNTLNRHAGNIDGAAREPLETQAIPSNYAEVRQESNVLQQLHMQAPPRKKIVAPAVTVPNSAGDDSRDTVRRHVTSSDSYASKQLHARAGTGQLQDPVATATATVTARDDAPPAYVPSSMYERRVSGGQEGARPAWDWDMAPSAPTLHASKLEAHSGHTSIAYSQNSGESGTAAPQAPDDISSSSRNASIFDVTLSSAIDAVPRALHTPHAPQSAPLLPSSYMSNNSQNTVNHTVSTNRPSSWDMNLPFNPSYVSLTKRDLQAEKTHVSESTVALPPPSLVSRGDNPGGGNVAGAENSASACDDGGVHDVGTEVYVHAGKVLVFKDCAVTSRWGGKPLELRKGDEIISINGEMFGNDVQMHSILALWCGKKDSLVNIVVKKGGAGPGISMNLLRVRGVAHNHTPQESFSPR